MTRLRAVGARAQTSTSQQRISKSRIRPPGICAFTSRMKRAMAALPRTGGVEVDVRGAA